MGHRLSGVVVDADGELGDVGDLTDVLGAGGAGGDHGPAAARAGAGTLPRTGADTGMLGGPAIAALALAAGIAAIRRRLG